MIYTGIGSRETPIEICRQMTQLAYDLAKKGYTLRSGAAGGADSAFEKGCDDAGGLKEIFLPWRGFNGSKCKFRPIPPEAYGLAEYYHPNWAACTQGAQKLHARNCQQILGEDLDEPSDFVICYTKDGKLLGGTATAIRIAMDYKIPIYNLGSMSINDVRTLLKII